MLDLIILFAASFLAATILPAQSELVLSALYYKGQHSAVILWLTASCANILGACVNWWIGRYMAGFSGHKWFPISAHALQRAQHAFQRWGAWSLLFAWVPIIGDPLTCVAGILKTRFITFLVLVSVGKALRYAALLAVLSGST